MVHKYQTILSFFGRRHVSKIDYTKKWDNIFLHVFISFEFCFILCKFLCPFYHSLVQWRQYSALVLLRWQADFWHHFHRASQLCWKIYSSVVIKTTAISSTSGALCPAEWISSFHAYLLHPLFFIYLFSMCNSTLWKPALNPRKTKSHARTQRQKCQRRKIWGRKLVRWRQNSANRDWAKPSKLVRIAFSVCADAD